MSSDKPTIRPMHPDDWITVPLETGRYSNPEPITGFQRKDKQGGNPLHPIYGDETFEHALARTFNNTRRVYPGVHVARYFVKMPYWHGPQIPGTQHYPRVSAPERLTTTAITVVAISQTAIQRATMAFGFNGDTLASLRTQLHGHPFKGIVGNLGYFMTANLIQGPLPWAHNLRYPQEIYHLPKVLSYLGFHWFRNPTSNTGTGGFQGAHPAAVGIRDNGIVEILPDLGITAYRVNFGNHEILIQAINDPYATDADVAVFTPGLWTSDVSMQRSHWRTYAPMIPLEDAEQRIHVFVSNEGNGKVPVEKALKTWEGTAPLPSFGAILSFKRAFFQSLFGDLTSFKKTYLRKPLRIHPEGAIAFKNYTHLLGGLVPAVIDGEHILRQKSVDEVITAMESYGNATSPIAQAGRESQNFDLFIREPAGVLFQTKDSIGWIHFDGRHELSIGASIVDVAVLLKKLEDKGALQGKVMQAVFIDGGSAMKAYAVTSTERETKLDLLNRVAAGGRNGPGFDPDGLNFYTALKLQLP